MLRLGIKVSQISSLQGPENDLPLPQHSMLPVKPGRKPVLSTAQYLCVFISCVEHISSSFPSSFSARHQSVIASSTLTGSSSSVVTSQVPYSILSPILFICGLFTFTPFASHALTFWSSSRISLRRLTHTHITSVFFFFSCHNTIPHHHLFLGPPQIILHSLWEFAWHLSFFFF